MDPKTVVRLRELAAELGVPFSLEPVPGQVIAETRIAEAG